MCNAERAPSSERNIKDNIIGCSTLDRRDPLLAEHMDTLGRKAVRYCFYRNRGKSVQNIDDKRTVMTNTFFVTFDPV